MTLIGIDFEYANGTPGSICRYGLAFEDGRREDGYVQLHSSCPVQELERFHGISQEQTDSGMGFEEFYSKLRELTADEATILVAHDLKSDRRAFLAAQALFGLEELPLRWLDSQLIARRSLSLQRSEGGSGIAPMAERYGLTINHHQPADDAWISLEIALREGDQGLRLVCDGDAEELEKFRRAEARRARTRDARLARRAARREGAAEAI